MGFEDTLRERLMELPVPEATTGQLRAMRDRVATRERRHKHRRRSAVWVSVAAAVLVAGGAAYAWRAEVLQQQPVRSQATVPKPSDVQVSFWPVAPLPATQPGTSSTQQFEVSVAKWPKGFTQQVVMAMVSINQQSAEAYSYSSVGATAVSNSPVGIDGGPLSWQNAINAWLHEHGYSDTVQGQVIDPNASHGYGNIEGRFIVSLAGLKTFDPSAWRLVVLDVADTGGQMYEVKWAKVFEPQVPHSFTEAVARELPQGTTNVKALWQTGVGNQSFGLFQYQNGGQTYLITASGDRFSTGYWSTTQDFIGGLGDSQLNSGGFQTISGSMTQMNGVTYDSFVGTAELPGADHVKVAWSDGKTNTLPVKNGAFGELLRYSSLNGANQVTELGAEVLSKSNQVLATESVHITPAN